MIIMPNEHIQYAFLDSGIGGLPYLAHLQTKAPAARVAYIADTAHFPYGGKKSSELIPYAKLLTEKILQLFNPHIIVIACNTLSVTALAELRKTFRIPFIGTVSAIKRAAELSVNKRIGVIATDKTIHDPYLDELIRLYADGYFIEKRGDSRLVAAIENGLPFTCEETQKAAIKPAISQFMKAETDTIVLACTHFLHIAQIFQCCAPSTVRIIDSIEGVINQTLKVSPPSESLQNSPVSYCYVTSRLDTVHEQYYRQYCSRYHLQWNGIL